MMLLSEAADEFRRLSVLLDQGLTTLREQASALAEAENEYRKAKREAWALAPSSPNRSEWTDSQRLAWVNAETADLRQVRDIAEGMRQTALEAVRSRRAQLSAWQSYLAAEREETALARTGPRYEP